MRVVAVRVQNFRCVLDSGDIPVDPELTLLIGENESGKSTLLDALYYFNRDLAFSEADLSTLLSTRESVLGYNAGRDTVDIVTVTVKLSDEERDELAIPETLLPDNQLRVTKRFDNSYRISERTGAPLSEVIAKGNAAELFSRATDLRRQLQTVYEGEIIRKEPHHEYILGKVPF